MKKTIILTALLFSFSLLHAGGFKVFAKVEPVKQTEYYKILLSPDIISFTSPDYQDVRLFDPKNNEVPYIFREEQSANTTSGFKEYTLLENKYYESKKYTRVLISNAYKEIISTLNVVVRNTDIDKEITLKGSDNQSDWFIIRQGRFTNEGSFNETSQLMSFTFPKSNYKYLELNISDKKKDPIQVIAVGYYDSQVSEGLYSAIPVKQIKRTDSTDHKTYVTLSFDKAYEISKLELAVSGPELYRRNCILGMYVKEKQKKVFLKLAYNEISSKRNKPWELDKIRSSELVLVIENSDNAPFTSVNIKAYQLNKYLVAKLRAGETYEVRAGNAALSYPDYDLKYFADSIPENLTVVQAGIVKITGTTAETSKTFFTKTVLWGVIILVIGLLGIFSVRMIKEMKKEKE